MILSNFTQGKKFMPKIITGNELKELLKEGILVENSAIENAEGIKYDFRLGTKLLKSCFNAPIDIEEDLIGVDRQKAVVDPGEVVFILSKERLNLPNNIYIQLSPKRSLSQDGIELLGGLTVDPGYEGYLVFGLRNMAGKPYPLLKDTKIVGANFFRLADDESINECKKPQPIDTFPQRLQDLIDKYKPVNPQNLAEELNSLKKAFEDSQCILTRDVGELKEQITKFAETLQREGIIREHDNKTINEKLSNMGDKMDSLNNSSIVHSERLNTLKDIDMRTRNIEDALTGSKIRNEIGTKAKTIILTAFIAVITTVVAGAILYHLGLI